MFIQLKLVNVGNVVSIRFLRVGRNDFFRSDLNYITLYNVSLVSGSLF